MLTRHNVRRLGRSFNQSMKASAKVARATLQGNALSLLRQRPQDLERVLSEYGDKTIVSVDVYRDPIAANVEWILDHFTSISSAIESLGYDNVYHLYIELTFSDGTILALEKNERVVSKPGGFGRSGEHFPAGRPAPITLRDLIENTERLVGTTRLYQYDARNFNCQRFVIDLLATMRLFNPEAETFILQNAGALLTRKEGQLAKTITNVAAFGNYIAQGGGW